MTSNSIVSRFRWRLSGYRNRLTGCGERPPLHILAQKRHLLPRFVQESPLTLRYLELLGCLDWSRFPERDLDTNWGIPTLPFAPFVAAYLIKLDQHFTYIAQLRRFLVEQPALVWVLGFPLKYSRAYPWGFDTEASLPTQRHFARLLRKLPNTSLQVLLDQTVHAAQRTLAEVAPDFGQVTSLDTKHILAWVKENNPKAYVAHRYDKTQQPTGDSDCRLGCKRQRNQRAQPDPNADAEPELITPRTNPRPARTVPVNEYYWGYGSGIIATKVANIAEFVIAELTQTFECSDVSYFSPLTTDAARRLGFRPRYMALDAAFDAFYVYAYFHHEGQSWQTGFAAVPWAKRGPRRQFDKTGLPLCPAGLPMPCKSTFISHTAFVEHERGRYVCPLLFPAPTAAACPIADPHWPTGGCTITMPTSIGARLRFQIDRESQLYQDIYKQRTATERINSQAVALGIERPKLRNGQAIINQNTLIYILINLRALQRVQQRLAG